MTFRTGDNSANQNLSNDATSTASNDAEHYPDQRPVPVGELPRPVVRVRRLRPIPSAMAQEALTGQLAASSADAHQNGVNANVPVNIAGGDVSTGDNSANQNNSNDATSTASNYASTTQSGPQSQSTSSPGPSYGSGGSGQAQFNTQEAATGQAAFSHADANQNGVNTNAPVNVAGGDVRSGDNSANQNLSNDANSTASNDASTTQNSDQSQSASSPGPSYGSGGSGQFQANGQEALTGQLAASSASAHQNGVNANVPVNIAGGDVSTGDNSANQDNSNGATSTANNNADTTQNPQSGGQSQTTS